MDRDFESAKHRHSVKLYLEVCEAEITPIFEKLDGRYLFIQDNTSKPGLKKYYIPREPITTSSIHDPRDFRKKSNKLASTINSLEGMKPALKGLIRNLNVPLRLGVVGAAIDNLDIIAIAKKNKRSLEFSIIIIVTKIY
jgi:hypothetical protein